MNGLGYVGPPLAVAFAEAGQHVVGVDATPRARSPSCASAAPHIGDISNLLAVGTEHVRCPRR